MIRTVPRVMVRVLAGGVKLQVRATGVRVLDNAINARERGFLKVSSAMHVQEPENAIPVKVPVNVTGATAMVNVQNALRRC